MYYRHTVKYVMVQHCASTNFTGICARDVVVLRFVLVVYSDRFVANVAALVGAVSCKKRREIAATAMDRAFAQSARIISVSKMVYAKGVSQTTA